MCENAKLPSETLVPIHGDMHLDQWLFDGKQLVLLDFEDFSLGEVERDLASFIVQTESEYPRFSKEFNESFLAGFRSKGFRENERLMNFYKAHKWLAKAAKVENEAEKQLDKALQKLELLG
ncbi:MAG: phosphotransferase [Oscillatoriales cyanobacterium RU_3_3]|nr:phosphotransferase [Oscillatoriales cyanobacterium RU_3_3]